MPAFGLILAFIAFLSWGFGDFFIQRSVRSVGSVAALFSIGTFGFIVLTPFVWEHLASTVNDSRSLLILGLTFTITLVVALLQFESFKIGKLSVLEPVMTLELPLTVFIGMVILGEQLALRQILLMAGVFVGVLLTVVRREHHYWWHRFRSRHLLEAGVSIGILSAVIMAVTNICTGLAGQRVGPFVTIWFVHTGLAIACLLIMIVRRNVRRQLNDIRRAWPVVLGESMFDNLAWISYSAAVRFLPISLTIGITESYVALASLLGIIRNRERLQRQQYVGIGVALCAAILLAIVSER